jgi:hypothetical protein
MLVSMLAHLDQFLGNPTRLDQTVGNQSCDPTKSSHNQGEMERSNNQTKHGPTNSSVLSVLKSTGNVSRSKPTG